jgi:hypothetical protein
MSERWIEVRRAGKCVQILFATGAEVERPVLRFELEQSDEVYAALIATALRESLQDIAVTMRRTAYEQGWKDAKEKRRRKTDFGAAIDDNPVWCEC